MKNKLIVMIFIAFCVLWKPAFSETIFFYEGKAKIYNDMFKMFNENEASFAFDTESSNVDLFLGSTLYIACIPFIGKKNDNAGIVSKYEKANIEKSILTNALTKYLAWRSKAIEKQVKVDKTITNLSCVISFKYGDDWYLSKDVPVSYSFLSQSTERHQFIIGIGKAKSTANEYISMDSEYYYFEYEDVLKMLKALNNSYILSEVKKETEKKKAVDEDFK